MEGLQDGQFNGDKSALSGSTQPHADAFNVAAQQDTDDDEYLFEDNQFNDSDGKLAGLLVLDAKRNYFANIFWSH